MNHAYYSENDPKAAAWLRELIKENHIAPGDVDERDIRDVRPDDLLEYTQCHFFAGIGGWSLALRRAGWADSRPVWTGSSPCPPFSSAGKQFRCPECDTRSPVPNAVRTGAFNCIRCGHEWQADERHLWPELFRLRRHNPDVPLFGEQVASKDGRTWVDVVRASLEMLGNTVGVVDACAAGFGSPNIRQRLWFSAQGVADPQSRGLGKLGREVEQGDIRHPDSRIITSGRLANTDGRQRNRVTDGEGCQPDGQETGRQQGHSEFEPGGPGGRPGPTNGFWRDVDWLLCRDGKWRPVESGTFPLVDGVSSRVGLLRGFGNAINIETAKTFIESYMEIEAAA